MSGFSDLQNIRVPIRAVDEMMEFLRVAGSRGCEGFALWVGKRNGGIFDVAEAIIPAQTGHLTDDGVCVSVGAEELHRLNVWLYTRKMNVIAQIHSHPGGAYHSDTDDAFPIATTVGCLSLVVPDFARFPFSLNSCATYRLTCQGIWTFVSNSEVKKLITIVN